MTLLIGALTMGLILSLLALGVYISFRIFGFPDITADGSITLGAAVAAVLAVDGMNPFLAALIVFLAGMAAGATTGILNTQFRINGLLAGILVMTALYSINLHVMGKSNVPLLGRSPRFAAEDVRRPAALARRVLDGETPLDRYLRNAMPADTRKSLRDALAAAEQAPQAPNPDLPAKLAEGLDDALQKAGLYGGERFKGVALGASTKELLALGPVGDDLLLLNRRLLDDALGRDVRPYHPIRTLTGLATDAGEWAAGGFSPHLTPLEIREPEVFLRELKDPKNPVSAFLLSEAPPATRKQLELYSGLVPPSRTLLEGVAEGINAVLDGPLWYAAARFAKAPLSPWTRARIAAAPTGEALLRLNRRLLDEAYPSALRTFVREKPVAKLNVLGWEVEMWDAAQLVGSFLLITVLCVLAYLFFRTNLGTAMRATGDNPDMIRSLGVNVSFMVIFGLALSNGLIALSGSLLAQFQGFADVQLGIGMIVWGLASVIIGEALVGHGGLGLTIVGAVMGSVLFRLLLAIALRWGLDPNDLKLVTAAFVFAALVLPQLIAQAKKRVRPGHA